MNLVILKGRLAADPETRMTTAGKAVVEFALAVQDDYQDKAGNKVERAHFIDCHCWGARGEAFARFHRKGSDALLHGKIVQEKWTDKTTGKERSKLRVNVEQWEFCGGKREATDAPKAAPKPASPVLPTTEDDVPF
jgi:single-strand DNA-binding protein